MPYAKSIAMLEALPVDKRQLLGGAYYCAGLSCVIGHIVPLTRSTIFGNSATIYSLSFHSKGVANQLAELDMTPQEAQELQRLY